MTLAEVVSRRLTLAGIRYDDPGLVAIRQWNAAVYARRPAERSAGGRRRVNFEEAGGIRLPGRPPAGQDCGHSSAETV